MSPNPYARLIELCERLTGATVEGRVEWVVEDETAFTTTLPAAGLAIRSRDRDGDAPYVLDISNPQGTKVETLLSEWAESEEPAAWNTPLYDLYRAARRQALGVDRILDALMADLPAATREDVQV